MRLALVLVHILSAYRTPFSHVAIIGRGLVAFLQPGGVVTIRRSPSDPHSWVILSYGRASEHGLLVSAPLDGLAPVLLRGPTYRGDDMTPVVLSDVDQVVEFDALGVVSLFQSFRFREVPVHLESLKYFPSSFEFQGSDLTCFFASTDGEVRGTSGSTVSTRSLRVVSAALAADPQNLLNLRMDVSASLPDWALRFLCAVSYF
jgi:hypothetical protein